MKKKSKLKYKSLADATPEQMREAFRIASLWLTDVLEGKTEKGAFSEKYLGEEARLYFPERAYLTLSNPNTKWHWKEGTKLSTLMINVIKSDMAHTLRKYVEDGEPDVIAVSELKRTSINITCYDRNGEVVKRVTSSDEGNVEDPEGGDDNPGGETPTGGGDPSTGGSGQGDGGGGDDEPGGDDH